MTIEPGARARFALARFRHRRRRLPPGSPLVVFSIAKSGSSAIAAALRSTGRGPVFHVHDLDPGHLRREEAEYRPHGRPWRTWDAQRLLGRPPTERDPWHVVSIVREPVAQTVSAFFQPGERRGYLSADTTVDSLRQHFGDRLDRLPLRWFETRLEPALGIDVYAHPFPVDRRHVVIETPTVRLLVLRFDALDAAPHALAELLALPEPVPVPHRNVGADKGYAPLYDELRAAIQPTPAQLDRAYASPFVRHFWSPEEIAAFRALWRDRSPGSDLAPGVGRDSDR